MNASTLASNFLSNSGGAWSKGSPRLADVLDFFFVAHPESGRLEGREGQRICYFFSQKNDDIVRQTQITGFAEAIVNFTDNFTSEPDNGEFAHRYVSTTKQLHTYILVEHAKFMIGVAVNKELCANEDYVLCEQAIKAILIRAYSMFCLFFGPFDRLLSTDMSNLKNRLEYFFSRYLNNVRLQRMPLLDMLPGVDFLSLDNKNYLRVMNFLEELGENFSQIRKTMFFYQERLITYNVSKFDMPILAEYLTQNLLIKSLKAELRPGSARESSSQKEIARRGKFLTGSFLNAMQASHSTQSKSNLPVVYLTDGENPGRMIPYQMIAYRALNASICIFIQDDVDVQFLEKLNVFLDPELTALASKIGDSFGDINDTVKHESDFRFIYYNPESSSLKTNFNDGTNANQISSMPTPPSSVIRMSCDAISDLLEENDFGNVSLGLESNWWLSAKKVNKRMLYLLLHSTTLTSLSDLQLLVNNIVKTNFGGIFWS